MQVEEENITRVERTGAHSHITGLGLDKNMNPIFSHHGLIGQIKARKAAGLVVKMAKQGKIAGRSILLSGPPGSGKSAIAYGMAHELGKSTPFTMVSASEIYSLEMSKSEALNQYIRKSIGVTMTETIELIEGEVVNIKIERPVTGGGSTIGSITLRTMYMESVFDLGKKTIESLSKQKIVVGDVISINKSTGKITKLGRSQVQSESFDAVGANTKIVSTPGGELIKTRQVEHSVTLHEIDVINSRNQGFLALFAGSTGEINPEVRSHVDKTVAEWKESGKATLHPGILFIDEAHILDIEAFSFLNGALESDFTPILVLATNRGHTTIRGTSYSSPHGIPLDFLDRTLIIPTSEYSETEISAILQVRCDEEDVIIEPSALKHLTSIGKETSLRYALHLISLSYLISKRYQSDKVTIDHINTAFSLFSDSARSTKYLDEYQSHFMMQTPSSKTSVSMDSIANKSSRATTSSQSQELEMPDF